MQKSVLVTGASGFIGSYAVENLLDRGYEVVGIDNLNDYYDVRLKEFRLNRIKGHKRNKSFSFYRCDIENINALKEVFENNDLEGVINLAARAGVRYSRIDPFVYVRTNVLGTTNILELCKRHGVQKFVLASTSSLYAGQHMPFNENLPVNEPVSAYAASKKGAEAMAHSYHYLYGIDVTVLRYFTVYGPAGRPDMSYFRFIEWIDGEKPIELFGDGSQSRDFTYIDDIAEGTVKALEACEGYEIINLGGNKPFELNRLIVLIEKSIGKTAKRDIKPFQREDLKATWADITRAQKILGWNPSVSLEEGISRTVRWHKENREWLRDISL